MPKAAKHLSFFMAALIAVFSLAGCGSTPTPTETADTFLKALKSQDSKSMSAVYEESDIDLMDLLSSQEESEALGDDPGLEAVLDGQLKPKLLQFDYALSNEQIKGDKATVDVTIKTYRFGDAITDFFSDFLSQVFVLAFSNASSEEIDALGVKILSEKLGALTEKTYEKTVPLTLTLKDKKWVVDKLEEESELVNAITGDLMTSLDAISNAFSE